jgi:GrpB-like predicted nucleotidyltransferase (UPF0157 family)
VKALRPDAEHSNRAAWGRAYAALKRDLALRLRDDREAYAHAKTDFVDAVVARLGGPVRMHPRHAAKR